MQRKKTVSLSDGPVSRDSRAHIEAVTSAGVNAVADDPLLSDPLLAYSQGLLARTEAIRLLRLRDYAALLVALGDADLPMPAAAEQDIEQQAITFATLWKQV